MALIGGCVAYAGWTGYLDIRTDLTHAKRADKSERRWNEAPSNAGVSPGELVGSVHDIRWSALGAVTCGLALVLGIGNSRIQLLLGGTAVALFAVVISGVPPSRSRFPAMNKDTTVP